jgi:hypothetical protein
MPKVYLFKNFNNRSGKKFYNGSTYLVINEGIFNESQIEVLMAQLAKGQGDFSESEAETVLAWANNTAMSKTILDLILQKKVAVKVNEKSDLEFRLVK